MRIAVVDDEQIWRDRTVLTIKCTSDYHDTIIDVFKSGDEYLKSDQEYDLTFVDIEMEEKDGFDTINEARETGRQGRFVILTTHTEFSMKGYRVNAFRYIDKVKMREGMKEVFETLHYIEASDKTVDIPKMNEENVNVKLGDIIYIETNRYYVTIHTVKGEIDSRIRLADLETVIEDDTIFRCHNSFIINLNKVRTYDKHFAYMMNNEKVEISKRRYAEFRRRYMKIKFSRANF